MISWNESKTLSFGGMTSPQPRKSASQNKQLCRLWDAPTRFLLIHLFCTIYWSGSWAHPNGHQFPPQQAFPPTIHKHLFNSLSVAGLVGFCCFNSWNFSGTYNHIYSCIQPRVGCPHGDFQDCGPAQTAGSISTACKNGSVFGFHH